MFRRHESMLRFEISKVEVFEKTYTKNMRIKQPKNFLNLLLTALVRNLQLLNSHVCCVHMSEEFACLRKNDVNKNISKILRILGQK